MHNVFVVKIDNDNHYQPARMESSFCTMQSLHLPYSTVILQCHCGDLDVVQRCNAAQRGVTAGHASQPSRQDFATGVHRFILQTPFEHVLLIIVH